MLPTGHPNQTEEEEEDSA